MRKHASSSRWQGIFEALGFARREPRGKVQSPQSRTLRIERLEERRLLTVLYWDPLQGGGANLGGSGQWTNGGAAVWYNPATRTDVAWNSANGDTAVFQGTAGTVAVRNPVAVGSIGFGTNGYTLTAVTINLIGNTTPGWSDGEIRVQSGITDTITCALGGSLGLTKTGAGTLILTGDNMYSGATAIENGTLAVAGGDNRLPTGATVTLGYAANQTSGILQLGDGTTASNQTLAGLTNDMAGTYEASGNRVVGGGSNVAMLTLNVGAGADCQFDGILGGTGTYQNNLALTMSGPGTEELGAVNTYSGATTLNAGVLAGNDKALGTGSLTLAGGIFQNLAPTSYYVDPAGLGGTPSSNTGATNSPFATLAAAYRLAKPGDTIVLRGGTYHLANLGYSPHTGGEPGAPLTIEAAPGEQPIIDLSESETWQQDSNGYWYADLPANSWMLSDPLVQIRNGAAATQILGDPVSGGPPAAFTQPNGTYYQNGQLAFDLTWYDTATHRLWFRSNQIQPITNPDTQCGVINDGSVAFEFSASWLVIKGMQIQNGWQGIQFGSDSVQRADHEIVEDCRVTNMWDQGIIMGNSSYNEISNNYVDAVGGHLSLNGTEVYRGQLNHDLYIEGQGESIHDNFFGRAYDGASAQVECPDAMATTVFANNVCYGGEQFGVVMNGNDIVFTGNVIISPATLWRGSPPAPPLADGQHYGIVISSNGDCSNIVVSGNYIEGAYIGVGYQSFGYLTGSIVTGWVLAGNTIVSGLYDAVIDRMPAEMGSNQWSGDLSFLINQYVNDLNTELTLKNGDIITGEQKQG